MAFSQTLFMLILLLHVSITMGIEAINNSSISSISKPGCPSQCGNVSIPYPFGIGRGCYRDKAFEIICNSNISKPYLNYIKQEVLNLSMNELRVRSPITKLCYNSSTGMINSTLINSTNVGYDLSRDGPFTYSNTRNKFTALGCDIFAFISYYNGHKLGGCASLCRSYLNTDIYNSSCLGVGCCSVAIPGGVKQFQVQAYSVNTQSRSWEADTQACSYASIHDGIKGSRESFINYNTSDKFSGNRSTVLPNNYFHQLIVGATLDWSIGAEKCKNVSKHECGEHSECYDPDNAQGYRCRCLKGFEGNPYLRNGCTDINECKNREAKCWEELSHSSSTSGRKVGVVCVNTPGSYTCKCPNGYAWDGSSERIGCFPINSYYVHRRSTVLIVSIGIGVGLGSLLILAIGFWSYRVMKRRQQIKLKQKFFKRNGGLLLEQQISSSDGSVERTKVFVTKELETATDNFNEGRIIGRGGSGTVYKGMLSDGRIVAIKKSKVIDESQIAQFINELVLLSQINHRNIVRLLGCCLETEVPLLVYEYVSNGTLSHRLHSENLFASISWADRLRISREISGALSYLHSSASMPIFHRDIKSSNILLDERNRAKLSDFGISRSVPFDKTHLTTLVQGTFGYLDPEYFRSGQFTEKSDVYSFGVVLVELLTGEKPVNYAKAEEDKNLAMHFISAVKGARLVLVLEQRVMKEASKEDILIVAKLAKRCLKLVGKKRPTMREVANELEKVTNFQDQEYLEPNCDNNNHDLVRADEEEDNVSICISTGTDSQDSFHDKPIFLEG
ncbi:hypothetical protein Sjap_004278 [Stephania japonica]|uniref:Uncharacterized protein n=1 Tax=Stephania japonica TaxID=461633 RepID=A0AAP0K480_9MAGN